MKFYLSSFHLGDSAEELPKLFGVKKVGYIPNALDAFNIDEERLSDEMQDLNNVGLETELLDLKQYFGKKDELRNKLSELGGVFVNGGNTFVLRDAMKLSGFDELFWELQESDFVYAGYSAGICVLAPSLKGIHTVDDPNVNPYDIEERGDEALGFLDYLPLPHYKSDHPESADIDKEIAYCEEQGIPYKTLRDGDVIII